MTYPCARKNCPGTAYQPNGADLFYCENCGELFDEEQLQGQEAEAEAEAKYETGYMFCAICEDVTLVVRGPSTGGWWECATCGTV